VAVSRSFSDGRGAISYVLGFKDNVLFPYGENRPESKTTRMFRPVSQLAAPGAKSAVSECMLFSV